MANLKTFLVVNPRSGNGATGRSFVKIAEAVRRHAGGFDYRFTSGPMEAAAIARQAVRDGYESVVAVGGDGTANEVVNGLFEEDRPLNEKVAFGVIPCGTGGDFRKTFGWSTDLEEAAERLAADTVRPVDLGRLDFVDRQGRPAKRYFVNIASAGVSGLVDFEVNRTTKALGGKASFAIGTLRALLKYRDRTLRVSFDDGPAETVRATVLAVANGQFFGGGMWVAPDARPDDGLFDITLWSGFGLGDFALKGRALYSGKHVTYANTRRLRAKKVHVEADEETLLDVDGEQPGRLPATFTILPRAMRLKVAPPR